MSHLNHDDDQEFDSIDERMSEKERPRDVSVHESLMDEY